MISAIDTLTGYPPVLPKPGPRAARSSVKNKKPPKHRRLPKPSEQLSLLHLAALQTARANAHAPVRSLNDGADRAQIYVPAPLCNVMGVADVISKLRPLAADFAYACHLTNSRFSRLCPPRRRKVSGFLQEASSAESGQRSRRVRIKSPKLRLYRNRPESRNSGDIVVPRNAARGATPSHRHNRAGLSRMLPRDYCRRYRPNYWYSDLVKYLNRSRRTDELRHLLRSRRT